MPRGGRRPGAGRKPKARVLAMPGGYSPTAAQPGPPPTSNTAVVAPPTTNPVSPAEEFDAPDHLSAEERAVWLKQSPHAFRHGTLTRATAMAFERYCKVVVLERHEAQSSGMGGPNHRGLLKQINAYELQFLLSPNGRSMAEPARVAPGTPAAGEAVSKLSRFRK